MAVVRPLWANPTEAAVQMVFEREDTPITVYGLQLTAQAPVTYETRRLTPGSDPVLHLFDADGRQVAVDDNGAGNRAARITYTPAGSGAFRLLVRARNGLSTGGAVIYKDGVPMAPAAAVGGAFVNLANLRAAEEIATAVLPRRGDQNRHRSSHGLYLISNDGLGIDKQATESAGMGPRMAFPDAIAARTVMVAQLIHVRTPQPAPTGDWVVPTVPGGPVRVMRNDVALAGHDPDKDGLGSELERELGTCAALNPRDHRDNHNCAFEARDTDGDGIGDGWEVLGRAHPLGLSQPLPVWGANPRHKDLFIEADFMRRTKQENLDAVKLRMSPAAVREFAVVFGDGLTTDPADQSNNARAVRNPDLRPGISVHIDTGAAALNPDEVTIHGDWGGYTSVDAIQGDKDDGGVTKHTDGTFWKGVRAQDSWKKNMLQARRGIFRYALSYGTGGGSTGEGFTSSYNFLDGRNAVHETGHSMGLDHAAPFSAPQAARGVNCKPNYPSVMNYAFYGDSRFGFSDGRQQPSLNNARLSEFQAVKSPDSPASVRYMDVLSSVYGYQVDQAQGHVDWNRDGQYAPQGTTVPAYANYQPGGDCEYTRHNQVPLKASVTPGAAANGRTSRPPALARIGNRLYAFWVNGGRLWYAYSTSPWDCQEIGTGCGRWQEVRRTDMAADGGVDAERVRVRFNGSSAEQVLVVTIDGSGKIWERRINSAAGGYQWSRREQVPGGVGLGPPSLAATGDGSNVYLVYKNPVHRLMQNRLVTYIGWTGEKYLRVQDGSSSGATFTSNVNASPGLAYTFLPSAPGVKALYGIFAPFTYDVRNGVPVVYAYDETADRWRMTDVIEGAQPLYGRPATAWQPSGSASEYPGRFYLVYPTMAAGNEPGPLAMLMTYKKGPDQPEKVGVRAAFDNAWLLSYGVDLIFEPGADTNLRALFASAFDASGSVKTQLYFRPKADGINDYEYTNYNDWHTLRLGLCRHVTNPAGDISNPIKCRP
ncbi:hypothetical protein ACIBQ1_52180 [Nonomuraea sp. NPDC050153]|uniref:hypothetical protein n=1 Tax=Nonomuraea sp. NPDC050153 TaxID=3364359 RepID=UPI0037A95064